MLPPAIASFGIDLVGLIGYAVSAMGRWLSGSQPPAGAKTRRQRVTDAADLRRNRRDRDQSRRSGGAAEWRVHVRAARILRFQRRLGGLCRSRLRDGHA